MLYTGKHTAPVRAVESLVNDSTGFNIHSIATQNFVIYPTKQIQQSALIQHVRAGMGSVGPHERILFHSETVFVSSPCFGCVLRRLLSVPYLVHVAP